MLFSPTRSVNANDLDSFAVVLHVDLAVAGDLACLDHRLEMCQVIQVSTHVCRQHLYHDSHTHAALSFTGT